MVKTNWFVKYERDVLYSLINSKRMERDDYTLITDEAEINRIIKRERKADEEELDTIKRLINDVRGGREL